MTWVKLDEAFGEHPKIARLSDSALALWVTGLAYCNRNLTDGFIPSLVGIGQLRYCDGNAVPPIHELEDAGLWDEVPGGWMVHDYEQYQPSKESVLAEREAARERAAKSRARHAVSSPDVTPHVQRDFAGSPTTAVAVAVTEPVTEPEPEDQLLAPRSRRENVDKSEHQTLAEILLAPDSRSRYLLGRLQERDEKWDEITTAVLLRLGKKFGAPVVIDALADVYEDGSAPFDAFPYLEANCVRIAAAAVSA